ncbi:hypothetical protein Poly41_50050 [Novipirellula artificiosorum]|uniref:Uncharacterized protein n=2 Tax=Novipirellula artificiosorum TaxID=2528016 RepID=A0A5C6D7T8_9BACT|nr:hypothetical protein Poly41_50050 [Novipirellula artificiosorum]
MTFGLSIIGITMTDGGTFPNAILWGVLATCLRFVPHIGPTISATFPLAIALSVFPGYNVITAGNGLEAVLATAQAAPSLEQQLGKDYTYIGSIKPRHARDIKASNWSIGAETMDRDFTICEMKYPDKINYKGLMAINDDKTIDHAKQGYYAIQNLASVFDNTLLRIQDLDFDVNTENADRKIELSAYRGPSGGGLITYWRANDKPGRKARF